MPRSSRLISLISASCLLCAGPGSRPEPCPVAHGRTVTTEAAACCIRGWKRGSHSAPCGRAARRTQRTQPWASYECVGGAPFLAAFSPSNSAFFSRRSWSILCARSCASMRALQEAAVAGACAGACAQARTTRARHRQVWAHDSALTRSGDAGGPPRAGRAVAGHGAPPDRPYWHCDKMRQKAPPLVHRQNGVCEKWSRAPHRPKRYSLSGGQDYRSSSCGSVGASLVLCEASMTRRWPPCKGVAMH